MNNTYPRSSIQNISHGAFLIIQRLTVQSDYFFFKPLYKPLKNNFMQRTFSGSLALTKLKHKIINVKNEKQGDIKGIFIPIAMNHLVEGKNNSLYLPVRVISHSEPDKYGQHGFIAQSVDSKVWKDASDVEKDIFKSLPILGNIKDFDSGANDAAGQMEELTPDTIDDTDDLPY